MDALLHMSWEAWLTLGVVATATVTMAREKLGPDLVMFSALCVLVVFGIVDPSRALVGFARPEVTTIGVLFICAAAVQETGALKLISNAIFGKSKHPLRALVRLTVPTAFMSAFMNNTPIVAMFIPMVRSHAIRLGVQPSTLLIPLSYAAMFGGTCTLIGTSANLVVSGLLAESGREPLGMLEIGKIGVFCTTAGLLYLFTIGRRLVPSRKDPVDTAHEDFREYLAELEVARDAPLVGKTVEDAGLRALPGLFLAEIRRADGREVHPVAPEDRLRAGDHLVFTGIASTVTDLVASLPGLRPVDDPHLLQDHELFEVVISHRSPLVDLTVRDAEFRRRYNAAILAVHRAGERIDEKIGDIVMRPGDTLLLLASQGFRAAWQNSAAFYLVSELRVEPSQRYRRARIVLATMLGLVLVPAITGMNLLVPAMGALVILVATGCIGLRKARSAVNWTVLVLIGSSFGIAGAMEQSGAAQALGAALVEATAPFGPRAMLAGIYIAGVVFASFVSNAASAALIFPIALQAAEIGGYEVRGFVLGLALAASAGFSTPIGCQPNLLVYGPGGYRYLDFTRVGLPLNVLFFAITIAGLPLVWPLTS